MTEETKLSDENGVTEVIGETQTSGVTSSGRNDGRDKIER